MDTDTACARQQVMLRAKYSNDVRSERERQSEKKGRQKRGGQVWLHPVYSPHSPSSVGT